MAKDGEEFSTRPLRKRVPIKYLDSTAGGLNETLIIPARNPTNSTANIENESSKESPTKPRSKILELLKQL